ncbi:MULTISPECIES: hypothetical protein [Polymorphospora]|uniref:Uncharacterized protein n=1 Tax=Polymorphospora lycopeni TaxID=3140240 RepID=A0ABV5CX52_9ACTN
MRRALERLVVGVFRSRVWVAVALGMAIFGIVALARLVSGPDGTGDEVPRGAPVRPLVTIDPGTGDDGVVSPPPQPSIKARPGTPAPETVARAFAAAWVDHQDVSAEDWHAALLPHSTAALADKLSGVDPAVVPASRVTGDPALTPYAEGLADATVPVDSGRLRLRMVTSSDRWLVDGVDWERA